MNIAFLSSIDPTNIRSWSGTLYYMYHSLAKDHSVTWIGGKLCLEIANFHRKNHKEPTIFIPEEYASLFGYKLSEYFSYECYDLIICRDYFFLAYLSTNVPVIYIGDTTFRLFNPYMNYTDPQFVALAEELERRAIQKATHIVYASQWAKNSAIQDYQADPSRVSVFEFGANLENPPVNCMSAPDDSTCHLLFIGKKWKWKGGDKAIEIYQTLKRWGMPCTLTIIGSTSPDPLDDTNIRQYPYLDKSTEEGRNQFAALLRQSHFLIAPTRFDCFGIVYAEAAAYGIPVLTSDVGGVPQAVYEGENGFLFPVDASADCYANRIIELYANVPRYTQLREMARKHYKERLNWEVWRERMNKLFTAVWEEQIDWYIPAYVISLEKREERRKHIVSQFEGRIEFDFHLEEASDPSQGAMGIWNSIVEIVSMADNQDEKVVILCTDHHFFTDHYSANLLRKEIQEAYGQGAQILFGGIGEFGYALPMGGHRYRVDWFRCAPFMVIYASFFDAILSYSFKEDDTVDGVLSALASEKMVIYPFISESKDFGSSDVTQKNRDQKESVQKHFEAANKRLEAADRISKMYRKF